MANATKTESTIHILEIKQGAIDVFIVGESPIICNRMTNKGARELLFPRGKKTAAEKASSLKHDPIAEFRASPYINNAPNAETRIQLLTTMFKKAMMTAALDQPGAKRTQIGRLTYVEGEHINVYGTPKVLMAVTRSADINKTPDIRTRAILPRWACKITVKFVRPNLRETDVVNLLAAAGVTSGIGDWRVEKGSGSYGRFRLAAADDPVLQEILKEGREAQDAALANPEPYNEETNELLSWFDIESRRRGFKVA